VDADAVSDTGARVSGKIQIRQRIGIIGIILIDEIRQRIGFPDMQFILFNPAMMVSPYPVAA